MPNYGSSSKKYVRKANYSSGPSNAALAKAIAGLSKKIVKKDKVIRKKPEKSIGMGEKLGSMAGRAAENLFGKWLGLGEYHFSRNSLMLGDSGAQVPFMHSSKDGVRIRHREFLQDISSSVTFANTSFSVNPGLSYSFPWLSAVAQNFEEYRMEGCYIEFKSTSADALNSTNTALGTVIIAAEYNTTQPAYINKQQMENTMWCVSGKPSESLCMPIECAPQLNPLSNMYIRTGAIGANQDSRFYDLCNFQVATVGSQAAAVVGELWITYDIVLLKPQLVSGPGQALKSAHYSLVAPAVTTAYLGTSRTAVGTDSIGLTLTGTSITLPIGLSGFYFLDYTVRGASTACTTPSFAFTNSSQVTYQWNNGNNNSSGTSPGETTLCYSYSIIVKIPDPTLSAVITLSGGTLPSSSTYGDLFITQVDFEMIV